MLALLADIQRQPHGTLPLITPDLSLATHIGDNILVMQHGQIIESGSTMAIVTNPQAPYTRALLAAVSGRHWHFAQGQAVAGGQA